MEEKEDGRDLTVKEERNSLIAAELVEQIIASLETKRIDLVPSATARLARHLCCELLCEGKTDVDDEDAVFVDLDRVEKVVLEVETWLELNNMRMHPMDKAELVRSVCEETTLAVRDIQGLVWRKLSVYTAGE